MRVLVLDGNENQAVATTRSLAGAGHTVIVGASTKWSKAAWSRAASGSFTYPPPQQSADDFVARIVEEVKRESGTLVIPMTERTTLPISDCREELVSVGARLILPPHATVLRAFDKQETTSLACSLGIAVPRTFQISSITEAERLTESIPYPVVLKPRSSEVLSPGRKMISTGAPRYACTPAEFIKACQDLQQRCSHLLIQEYVPGTGTGYFALMNNGELRSEFAHRRIRDVRPTGSGSALRTSIAPSPKIRKAGLAILQALRWHGVAMVEFRERADGTPVFLEVNGRFWNSLPLAIYSGVDFPEMLARLARDGDIDLQTGYKLGVRCRWLLGDFRYLAEVWRGAPRGYPGVFPSRLRSLLDFFTPVKGTYHDNFTWSDPLPELGDWLDFALRRIPASLKRTANITRNSHAQGRYSLP